MRVRCLEDGVLKVRLGGVRGVDLSHDGAVLLRERHLAYEHVSNIRLGFEMCKSSAGSNGLT